MALLNLPIMLMNFVGATAGIIWLLFLGEWRLLIGWFVAGFAIRILNAISVIPTLLAISGADAMKLPESSLLRKTLFYCLGSISWIGPTIIPAFFFSLCVNYYLNFASDSSSVPYLLYAYSVATATYAWMAMQEHKADPTSPAVLSAFGIQVAALVSFTIGLVSIETLSFPVLFFTFLIPQIGMSALFLLAERERNPKSPKGSTLKSA